MPFKVRIFQPIVPEYRVALFDGLAAKYGDAVEVVASFKLPSGDVSVPLQRCRYDYAHRYCKIGPFVWQAGFSLVGLKGGRDVVVINGDIHQLSTLWIALKAKLKGIRIVWWGHHRTATSTNRAVAIRLWFAKRFSDVFLAYTRTGVKYLESVGFTVGRAFATGNTIDQVPIKAAIKTVEVVPTIRPLLLCCGVMREKIHLELAIRALADVRLKDVEMAVIGDGPMKASWQQLARNIGVDDRITWLPGTRDQMVMAPWFLKAKAFIYPGSIGLSILHSFSYGLPVITHGNADHQMPEFEVMEDGRTGVCFKENDSADLIDKIDKFLGDEVRRKQIGRYCQDVAFNRYSMNQMVVNFAQAIEGAHVL